MAKRSGRRLGKSRRREAAISSSHQRCWTEAEDALLIATAGAGAPKMGAARIVAARVGRTVAAVTNRADVLGLRFRAARNHAHAGIDAGSLPPIVKPRPCSLCHTVFQPDGRFRVVCDTCRVGDVWTGRCWSYSIATTASGHSQVTVR